MRALITGGAGFIGSHLADLLIQEGHEVIVLDNLSNGRMANLTRIANHPLFSFHSADICHKSEIEPLFKSVDWVFHLAGLADIVPSIESPQPYFDVNVQGTLHVLECAREHSCQRLIYAASSSCYGIPTQYPTPESAPSCPQYPYALTKYLGEQLVMHWHQVYHLDTLSLRLFNVYGPRSRTSGSYGAVFGVFLAQKLKKKPFTVVGDGTQTRDFTYVSDVAQAFLQAAQSSLSGKIFNVGSGHHTSINHLVQLLGGDVVHIPKRPGEPDCTFADIKKIQQELNWTPSVSFEEGVERLLQSIEDYQEAPLWEPHSIEVATKNWFKNLSLQSKSEAF